MGKTSLPLTDAVKDRLARYRRDSHGSWSAVLDGLMDRVPNVDAETTCAECDEPPFARNAPVEEHSGYIEWIAVETSGGSYTEATWFCSPECLNAQMDRREGLVSRNPDTVLVGGVSELEVTLTDATFTRDGHSSEVGVSIPGAFLGEDAGGNTYDYHEEPVYIINGGKVRASGIVGDIIHEDNHTALVLDEFPAPEAREMLKQYRPSP